MDKKNFADWFCESVEKNGGVSSWECFLKGQQSRQAEINQLQSQINEMAEVGLSQESVIREKDKRIEELESALTQIKSWESHPKNYETRFGSWGLRDFYRDLADKALRGEHE